MKLNKRAAIILTAAGLWGCACGVFTGCSAEKAVFEMLAKEEAKAPEVAKVQKKTVGKAEGAKAPENAESKAEPAKAPTEMPTKAPEKTGSADSYKIETNHFTGWVDGSQVNVRSDCSTDADILGQVFFQNVVDVNANVKNAEGAVEWYRIDFEGQEGYVSAAYISTAPSTKETLGIDVTDERKIIYRTDGEGYTRVYEGTDGYWYDDSGRPYEANGDGTWRLATDGTMFTEEASDTPADDAVDEVTIENEEGITLTIYQNEYGTWESMDRDIYLDHEDGTFTGPGDVLWHPVN